MIKWLHEIKKPIDVGALCIGAFDGVHLGHKSLVHCALKQASEGDAVGLSFSPHPREFFCRENKGNFKDFERILPESSNARLLKKEGLKEVYYVNFNKALSLKTTEEFLDFVRQYIRFSSLIVGFDFRLGNHRGGGLEEIKTWCSKNQIDFFSVEKIELEGVKISSTLIREKLKLKKFDEVESLQGHPYYLEGEPVSDQKLGRKLGFPTLNLKLQSNLVLPNGVYAAVIQIETEQYHAVVNFGRRPTLQEDTNLKTLEAHILEDHFLEPQEQIKVTFKKFLRAEQKFDSLQDLSLQVQEDIKRSRAFFNL